MIVASTTYESVLLILKIAFLVLLYLFIWRIVRTAAKDLRLPQESFILRPALAGGPIGQSIRPGRLVVLVSPVLELGEEYELDSSPLTVGRAGQNDVALGDDDFPNVSGHLGKLLVNCPKVGRVDVLVRPYHPDLEGLILDSTVIRVG